MKKTEQIKVVRIVGDAVDKFDSVFQQSRAFYASKTVLLSDMVEIVDGLAKKEGKNIPQLYSELVK